MGDAETILEQDRIDDAHLLERFAVGADEAAFALLVRRHGARVMRVCRGILRDEHDAEDVFQSTFLVLAGKAGTLTWHESVAGWLTSAAQRLARNARARRGRRERLASTASDETADCARSHANDDLVAEVARRELRAILEREVDGLPDKYRDPVVLCYLEGKTNEEAARTLGWPTGSMSRRLARARALLQQRLRALAIATGLLFAVAATVWGLAQQPRDKVTSSEPAVPALGSCAGGADLEGTLQALARPQQPALSQEQLDHLARRLEEIGAGPDNAAWQRHAGAMKRSALELSRAVRLPDVSARSQAARKLLDSCRRCHETFGE